MSNGLRPASLRTRLTWLIIAVMVAVLIPLGWISYRRELREMNELLDSIRQKMTHFIRQVDTQEGPATNCFSGFAIKH